MGAHHKRCPRYAPSTESENGLQAGVVDAAGTGNASDAAVDGQALSTVDSARTGTVGGERSRTGLEQDGSSSCGFERRDSLQEALVDTGGKGRRTASDSDGEPGAKRARQALPQASATTSVPQDRPSAELVEPVTLVTPKIEVTV